MKTPRLAFLALWALLAPLSAAASETWDPVLQSGDDWKSVSFTDENGADRFYWFRASAKGEHVPLYILTPKANPAVTGGSFYESKAAGYELKVTITPPKGRGSQGSTSYVVTRANTGLELTGTPSWTLGAQDWSKTHPPAYEEHTGRNGAKYKVQTNPYVAGSVKVLVNAPGDAAEKLDPSPMGHFKQGVAAVSWDDFYFERAPRAATGGRSPSDPDAGYRAAKERFAPLHRRVLPFEVILEPNNCFIRAETCTDEKKPVDQKYIQAGLQTKEGNNLLTENLALAGHAEYKAKALAFRGMLEKASDAEFTPQETAVLQRLLVNTGQTAAFQAQMKTARAKPETLKAFVHKWRQHLIKEVDLYVVASDAAKTNEVAFAAARKGLNDRAQATAAAPVTPHGGPAETGPASWCDPKDGKITVVPPGTAPAGSFKIPKTGTCAVGQRPPAPPPAAVATWCNPKDGKKTLVPPGTAPAGSFVIAKDGACAVGQAPPDVVAANPLLPLTASEKKWLTKRQQAELTDPKAARAEILKNLEPNATAVAGYGALIDAPTAAAIEAALPKKLWGGDVTTVVASSGTNLEIQLSGDEYKLLEKKPDALAAFKRDHSTASGNRGGAGAPVFSAADYDPIQLHLLTEAARKSLSSGAGSTTPTPPKPGAGPLLLNPYQLSLLTPLERQIYRKTYLEPYEKKNPGAEAQLQAESDRLRALIAQEKRGDDAPFAAPKSTAAFASLPNWHKAMFCDPKQAGAAAAAADEGNTIFAPGSDAMKALQDIERAKVEASRAATAQVASQSGKSVPDWARGPCAMYLANANPAPTTGGGTGGNLAINKGTGADKEIPAKEASKWVTQDLMVSAAKGALTGLLIGSLFGPVGLILGPLVGAAIFYGVTKLTT